MIDRQRLKRRLRQTYVRVMKEQGKPETIAGGVALGTFFGFIVPPGIQIIVSLGVAPILRVNPIAAVAGTWVSNPLTMPFIYPAAMVIGSYITGYAVRDAIPMEEREFWTFITSLPAHSRIIFVMSVGLSAMGGLASFIVYYATKGLVIEYRVKRAELKKRRLERRKKKQQRRREHDEA